MLIRQLEAAKLEDHLLDTRSDIEDVRESIWRELKRLKAQATNLRASWLLQENERRFNQAKDTPFLVPPLYDLIGPQGIGPHADAVLDGTFVAPPGTDPYAVKLLYQLKKDPAVDQAPPMFLDLPLAKYVRG
jgi:hypothetical protein